MLTTGARSSDAAELDGAKAAWFPLPPCEVESAMPTTTATHATASAMTSSQRRLARRLRAGNAPLAAASAAASNCRAIAAAKALSRIIWSSCAASITSPHPSSSAASFLSPRLTRERATASLQPSSAATSS